MIYRSTGQVAELFGIPLHRLDYLTRDRIIRPTKGPTGAFMWTPEEIRLAARRLGIEPLSKEIIDRLDQNHEGEETSHES